MSHGLVLMTLAVFGFAGTVALVPLARRVALLYGVTDHPGHRKLHAGPVPYLGGVAIVLTATAGSLLLENWSVQGGVLIIGAVCVAVVGLVDDMRTVRPSVRVAVEAAAATAVAAAGARVHLVGGVIDWALSIFAIVVVTNAFNLLDNMDGAAGAIATVVAAAVAASAALQGQWLVGGVAALAAGACLGFLRYNWYPATVFLGDAGSLFLGFLLGGAALKLRFPGGHRASVPAVVLLLGPALFDTALVVFARVRSGRPIYLGATDHTSHRLLRLGLSTRAVAVLLAFCSAVSASIGLALGRAWIDPVYVLPELSVIAVVAFVALLRLPDGTPRPPGEHAPVAALARD